MRYEHKQCNFEVKCVDLLISQNNLQKGQYVLREIDGPSYVLREIDGSSLQGHCFLRKCSCSLRLAFLHIDDILL